MWHTMINKKTKLQKKSIVLFGYYKKILFLHPVL